MSPKVAAALASRPSTCPGASSKRRSASAATLHLRQALAVLERRQRVADAQAAAHRVPGIEEIVARVVGEHQAP